MKRLFCLFIACCMAASFLVSPVYAAEVGPEKSVAMIELSDTVTLEISLETYQNSRSNIVSGAKIYTLKIGGKAVATATLLAEFGYNGSSAWVSDTDYSYSTTSGCTYSHGGIVTSGGWVGMTGSFYYGGTKYPFSITIICSADGTLS